MPRNYGSSRNIDVPSFWDYLSEGIASGHEAFQDQRAKAEEQRRYQEELRQKQEQQNYQNLNLAMQYGDQPSAQRAAGMIPSLAAMNFNPQETPRMAQDRLIKQPNISVPFASGPMMGAPSGQNILPGTDDERQRAGLSTSTDVLKNKFAQRQLQGAMTSFPQDEQISRIAKLTPVINSFAKQYVASETQARGGTINRKQMAIMTEAAFSRWQREYKNTSFGNLTPEDSAQAHAAFGEAMQNAWIDQVTQETARIGANARLANAADKSPQMINALNGIAKTKYEQWQNITNRIKELDKNVASNFTPNPAKPSPFDNLYNEKAALKQQGEYIMKDFEEIQSAVAQAGGGDLSGAQTILQKYVKNQGQRVQTGLPSDQHTAVDIKTLSREQRTAKFNEEWMNLPLARKTPANKDVIAQKWGFKRSQ